MLTLHIRTYVLHTRDVGTRQKCFERVISKKEKKHNRTIISWLAHSLCRAWRARDRGIQSGVVVSRGRGRPGGYLNHFLENRFQSLSSSYSFDFPSSPPLLFSFPLHLFIFFLSLHIDTHVQKYRPTLYKYEYLNPCLPFQKLGFAQSFG